MTNVWCVFRETPWHDKELYLVFATAEKAYEFVNSKSSRHDEADYTVEEWMVYND
jgi:hypothetical protein